MEGMEMMDTEGSGEMPIEESDMEPKEPIDETEDTQVEKKSAEVIFLQAYAMTF